MNDREDMALHPSDDRAAGLRPQPPAASSQSSIPSAWPLCGYAPGGYSGGACIDCGEKLDDVDKRGIRCLECAVRSAKSLMDKGARAITALRLFREFTIRNATQWRSGAGDHHHPVWGMMAELLSPDDIRSGTEWRFIQPENRETLSALQSAASGMSAGTAETPQEAQGQRPASPTGEAGDAKTPQNQRGGHD